MKRLIYVTIILLQSVCCLAQINVSQVITIGRNALYFEDYVLSIQYFNQAINADTTRAEPYFYRAVAKINLDDYRGAEQDASASIRIKPFIVDAFKVRGVARQNMGNYGGALEDYDAGLRLMPEDKMLLVNKAVCLNALTRYDDATAAYDALIAVDRRNDKAYLGLAHLCLARGDTVAARENIARSLEISKNNAGAYVMRAEIEMRCDSDYAAAMSSLDEAIKLEPRQASYFINRAYMKYRLDDYFGAMADYDYAIGLDPSSMEAHLNRAQLYAEVGEYNKAINDFSYVLKGDGGNIMALYNRAMLYIETGQGKAAVRDLNVVLDRYPEFEAGYMARGEAKRLSGDRKGSEADYDYAISLFKKKKTRVSDFDPVRLELEKAAEARKHGQEPEESEEEIKNRFNTLLTVVPENPIKPEYDNKQRGHVQDANFEIEPEPAFALTYFSHDNNLNGKTHYLREVADVNDSHLLPYPLTITNKARHLSDAEIATCFANIEYYNGLLSTSEPRPVDYLARAIDYLLVKNPAQSIADCDRVLAMNPNLSLAYMLRASARTLVIEMRRVVQDDVAEGTDKEAAASLAVREDAADYQAIIADLDQTIALSPKNVYAYFNRGIICAQRGELTEAISCYSRAIEIKGDLGEAYYNRGISYLRLGNKAQGMSDLSKAGELGILPSYNVLKRMNK